MTKEQKKTLLEGAYVQMPTLPGFFVNYEDLKEKFNQLLEDRGEQPEDFDQLLMECFPTARIEDSYLPKGAAEDGAFRAMRITPNKLVASKAMRNSLHRAYHSVEGNYDGWREYDEVCEKVNMDEIHSLGFSSVRNALECLFNKSVEFKQVLGDSNEAVTKMRLNKPSWLNSVHSNTWHEPSHMPTEEEMKAKIMQSFDELPHVDADAYKSFAKMCSRLNKQEVIMMGYGGFREAVECLFPDTFEFKRGDITKNEDPLQIRKIGDTATNIQQRQPFSAHYVTSKPSAYANASQAMPRLRQGSYIGHAIDEFAMFPKQEGTLGWDAAINNLAKLALEERWYFDEREKLTKPILKNYLSYTFERLQYEDQQDAKAAEEEGRRPEPKIMTNDRYAVWNTGLVNKWYEPIYAFFKRNNGHNPMVRQPWVFKAFNIADSYLQDIIAEFPHHPKRAEYFNEPSDLIYDSKANPPTLNWEHFLVDNIERLPLGFIKQGAPDSFKFAESTYFSSREERDEYFKNLSAAIFNDEKWRKTLTDRFKDALNITINRVTWNYRMAIPVYHVDSHKLTLLLPLALEKNDVTDVALVCEHILDKERGVNNYIGRTIFTLKMAYNNARLITRPDANWLTADMFARKKKFKNYQRNTEWTPQHSDNSDNNTAADTF